MGKNQRRIVVDGVWRRGLSGSTDQSTSPVNPSIRPSTLTTIFTTGSGNLFSTIFVGRKVDGRIDPLFFFFPPFSGRRRWKRSAGRLLRPAGQLFRIYRSAWFLISSFLHFLLIKMYESRSPLKRRESSLSPRMKKAHSSPLISVCCGTRILRSSRMLPRILSLLRFAAIFLPLLLFLIFQTRNI